MTDPDPRRFPTGPFRPKPSLTSQERDALIEELAHFPADFRFLVLSLPPGALDTTYREGGWTVYEIFSEWKTIYVDFSGKLPSHVVADFIIGQYVGPKRAACHRIKRQPGHRRLIQKIRDQINQVGCGGLAIEPVRPFLHNITVNDVKRYA